jgi:hypothetical protein
MFVGAIFSALFEKTLFSTGIFQSSQFRLLQSKLRNEPLLLQMALSLIRLSNWRETSWANEYSEIHELRCHELWLQYLNHAYSALALSDMQYVFVDSIRTLSKRLRSKKNLTD